jgi:hypothetical protein
MQLSQALRHWGTDSFGSILKAELENLPAGTLPLHQATSQGGMVDDSDISASILNSEANDNEIKIRVAVFFTEVIAGCNCNDPPMEANGYCVLQVAIDRTSGAACITVVPD